MSSTVPSPDTNTDALEATLVQAISSLADWLRHEGLSPTEDEELTENVESWLTQIATFAARARAADQLEAARKYVCAHEHVWWMLDVAPFATRCPVCNTITFSLAHDTGRGEE